MRRTTLGPMTQSGVNSRMSMGLPASRNPRNGSLMPTYKRGDDRRASAVPAPGHRRSSALTHGGNRTSSISGTARASMAYSRSGGRSDPRPLNDRPYMQHCVKNLISFVIERGYEQPISPKILTNPSSKDFQFIFLFLVRRIDPNFSFQKRFEDEIPVVLRLLGYPFAISKSALSAVGSPHTWPTLLGVLTWLYELLLYDEENEGRKSSDQQNLDPEARREKLFYDNMTEAYNQFLAGSDTYPELDEALEQQFEEENMKRREEIEKLEADLEQYNATLQALRTQPSPLQLVTDQTATIEANIKKFRLLIPSLLEHRDSLRKKDAEKTDEILRDQRKLEALTAEKQELLEILSRQEEAAIDIERMATERESLREGLSIAADDRSRAEKEQKQVEQELATEGTGLNNALRRYHNAAAQLQVVPETAKNARGQNYSISMSRDAALTQVEDIVPCEAMDATLEFVQQLQQGFSNAVPALREEALALQESGDEVEERLLVLRQEVETVEARTKKLEAEYEAEKSGLAGQLKKQSQDALLEEEEMAEARRKMQERLRDCDRRNETLASQQKSLEDQFERERRRLASCVNLDADICRKHKEAARGSILRVKDHFDRASFGLSGEQH